MEQRIIILSVDRYNMTTDDGKTMKGCTMFYYPSDNLNPTDYGEDSLGNKPTKESMPYEFFEEAKLHGIPCTAKVSYVMRPKNGNIVLKVDKLEFLQDKVVSK